MIGLRLNNMLRHTLKLSEEIIMANLINTTVKPFKTTAYHNGKFVPVSNDLSNLDIGAFAKPALADLNNDGLVDVVVGTYNGGLLYYQQSDIADALPNVPKNADIRIYPNPTNGQLTIELNNNFAPNTQLLIYDICGKLVLSETLSSAQNTHTLTLGHLSSGVYMLHLRNNGLNLVQKVVVR